MQPTHDSLLAFGDAVKVMADGRVGGYLVRFSTAKDPDLSGEFFTKSTYFGPRKGDGADMLFNHSVPIKAEFSALADHIFSPISTKTDEIGVWAEAVLDLSDKYERTVHELAAAGKLGWSSGAAGHMVRKTADGEITRWPIAEGSLTPIPAEPRNRVATVKSLCDDDFGRIDLASVKVQIDAIKSVSDLDNFLRDAGGFSRNAAKTLLNHLKTVYLRDAGAEIEELKRQLIDVDTRRLLAELRSP